MVGWAPSTGGIAVRRDTRCLSGRLGYELVQKAISFGVPIRAAVSAPSSLPVELAERFKRPLVGFVRRAIGQNVYAHGLANSIDF